LTVVNPLAKLIKADVGRKTRFHDLTGRLLPLESWISLPLAVMDMTLRMAGRRRPQPWISYRAARDIERLLLPAWRVLEFGAGMSTIWLAKHSKFVVSVEANAEWYRRVMAMLALYGLRNVDLRYRPTVDEYTGAISPEDGVFDLALIDGDWREETVAPALRAVRPGGLIYVDNADGPGRQAAELLLAVPREHLRYYTDLAPGIGAPTTGLLVRLKTAGGS
jgi:SAM-dependent methyltransferase